MALRRRKAIVRRVGAPLLRVSSSCPLFASQILIIRSIEALAMVLVMSDGTRETWTRAPAD